MNIPHFLLNPCRKEVAYFNGEMLPIYSSHLLECISLELLSLSPEGHWVAVRVRAT